MAAGVPVVATAVGGIPEIVVPGETGLLIAAPADARELADALARVLEDPSLRAELGRGARSRYESEFTATSWARRTRGLYDEVLGGRRR
jgi:glycosyltransferase involved in cell wall biosynthesis